MEKKIIRIITIIMAAVMILSLLLSLFASGMHVHAASSSEIKDQIDQLKDEQEEVKKQIAELEAQRKKNQADIKTLVAEKNNYDQQVGLLYTQIQSTGDLISAYNLLIADKQDELDASEKYLAELNDKHKERIRTMEAEGELSYLSLIHI